MAIYQGREHDAHGERKRVVHRHLRDSAQLPDSLSAHGLTPRAIIFADAVDAVGADSQRRPFSKLHAGKALDSVKTRTPSHNRDPDATHTDADEPLTPPPRISSEGVPRYQVVAPDFGRATQLLCCLFRSPRRREGQGEGDFLTI